MSVARERKLISEVLDSHQNAARGLAAFAEAIDWVAPLEASSADEQPPSPPAYEFN